MTTRVKWNTLLYRTGLGQEQLAQLKYRQKFSFIVDFAYNHKYIFLFHWIIIMPYCTIYQAIFS